MYPIVLSCILFVARCHVTRNYEIKPFAEIYPFDLGAELFHGRGLTVGEVQSSNLGPAAHCLNLTKLDAPNESIHRNTRCLRNYCSSITSPEECNLNENYKRGCSWCGGSCKPYNSYWEPFIECVRKAYNESSDPDLINGKNIPYKPSEPVTDIEYTNVPIGNPDQGSLPGIGNRRWYFSEVSRKAGYRVPIHVHPFAGLSCITTFDGEDTKVILEGQPDLIVPSGSCYSMPPMTKLGPFSAGGYSARDTFVWDTCYPLWVVIEPEAYFVQDKQFGINSTINCPQK